MIEESGTKVVVIDKSDNVLRLEDKIRAHKNPFPLHRAISVVIYDSDKILIQKRSSLKPTWPLYWSNTCCTHPYKGESYLDAAKRRLKEEMGISTEFKEKFRFIYQAKYDKEYGEHELDVVFIGSYSGKVRPNPKEVADYKWIKVPELLENIKKESGKYTPWFKIIIGRLHKG